MDYEGTRLRILFIGNGNGCRSQMAESWTRFLRGDIFDAYSAGIKPRGVDRLAVRAMREVDVEMGNQVSKGLANVADLEFDYVVFLCDAAARNTAAIPRAANIIHMPFDDPSAYAGSAGNEREAYRHYRRVRDEIRTFVATMPKVLIRLTAEQAVANVKY